MLTESVTKGSIPTAIALAQHLNYLSSPLTGLPPPAYVHIFLPSTNTVLSKARQDNVILPLKKLKGLHSVYNIKYRVLTADNALRDLTSAVSTFAHSNPIFHLCSFLPAPENDKHLHTFAHAGFCAWPFPSPLPGELLFLQYAGQMPSSNFLQSVSTFPHSVGIMHLPHHTVI